MSLSLKYHKNETKTRCDDRHVWTKIHLHNIDKFEFPRDR